MSYSMQELYTTLLRVPIQEKLGFHVLQYVNDMFDNTSHIICFTNFFFIQFPIFIVYTLVEY